MEKTAQQKRFEAAWLVKWPNDEPFIFEQDSKSQYAWPEVQDTFEGFALGEASALERAAKVCDLFALHHADNHKEEGGKFIEGQSAGADECATAIRALAQEVGK
jgi:hypothetical protein